MLIGKHHVSVVQEGALAYKRGPGRPPGSKGGVGAAVRKEVARVVEGMVRRLEGQERRDKADAAAVGLTLLDVVRKVRRWAGRATMGACCMQAP